MNSISSRFPIKHKQFINVIRNNNNTNILRKTPSLHTVYNSYRKTDFTKVTFDMIKEAINDASTFKGTTSEKAIYWDIVHELIVYYQKQQQLIEENAYDEPLETYCSEDESQLECRIYDL